jgi:hypothetical protein
MMPLDPTFGNANVSILIYADRLVTMLKDEKTTEQADKDLTQLLQLWNQCEDDNKHRSMLRRCRCCRDNLAIV